MADTLIPWSGNAGNPVTDSQYEDLQRGRADLILYGQAATALQVSVTPSGAWTVQPGKTLIAGHVFTAGAASSGQLGAASAGTRYDLVVVRLDRTTSPWTWGVRIHAGTSGGGVPAATVSPTGVQEMQLASIQILSSGAVQKWQDLRRYQVPGLSRGFPVTADGAMSWDALINVLYVGTGLSSSVAYEDTGWKTPGVSSAYWTSPAGSPPQLRRRSGNVYLRGGLTRATGAYPKAAGASALGLTLDTDMRPDGPWSDCVWVDSGAGWLTIDSNGVVSLAAIANDMPVGYSVHFGCSWPINQQVTGVPY